jgi:hypothetical protein
LTQKNKSVISHLGDFNVVSLEEPFAPERYLEAIKLLDMQTKPTVLVKQHF